MNAIDFLETRAVQFFYFVQASVRMFIGTTVAAFYRRQNVTKSMTLIGLIKRREFPAVTLPAALSNSAIEVKSCLVALLLTSEHFF